MQPPRSSGVCCTPEIKRVLLFLVDNLTMQIIFPWVRGISAAATGFLQLFSIIAFSRTVKSTRWWKLQCKASNYLSRAIWNHVTPAMPQQAGGRLMAACSRCEVTASTVIFHARCVSVFIKYRLTSIHAITQEVKRFCWKPFFLQSAANTGKAGILIPWLSLMYADFNLRPFQLYESCGELN